MKKATLISVLAVSAIIVVTVILSVGNKPAKVSSLERFTLATLNPEVTFREAEETVSTPVINQVAVVSGTTVETGVVGRAAILYPNQTITNLGPETTVKLEAIADSGNQSRLSLALGSVWAKIESVTGTGEYQIEAQNMVASVRGTILALEELKARGPGVPSQTHLLVFEGVVLAWPRDVRTGRVDKTAVFEVEAGEFVSATYDDIQNKVFVDKASMTTLDLERPIVKSNLTAEILTRPEVEKVIQLIKTRGIPVPDTTKPSSPKAPLLEVKAVDSGIIQVQPAVANELVFSVDRIEPKVIIFTRSSPPSGAGSGGATGEESARASASEDDSFSVTSSGLPPEQPELKIIGSGFQGVQAVLIGEREVAFLVKDPNTIMAFILPQFQPGQYDVSVVRKEKKTLSGALEIRYEQ
jgi:hypothetical protein